MKLEDELIFILISIVVFTVLFLLGRLVQLLLNIEKKPYIVRNVKNSNLASVYIYRIQRSGSTYIEYKFRKEDGKWKAMISKGDIIGGIIMVGVVFGISACDIGIKDSLIIVIPVVLYGAAVNAARYCEAYILLMRDKKDWK